MVSFTAKIATALVALLCLAANPAPAATIDSSKRLADAARSYSNGDYEAAATLWRDIAQSSDVAASERIRAALSLAAACQHMGLLDEGERALRRIEPLVRTARDRAVSAQFDQRLGNLYVAMHRHSDAVQTLERATTAAEGDARMQASILNDLANAHASNRQSGEALATYLRAMRIANDSAANGTLLSAALNAARMQLRADAQTDARATLAIVDRTLTAEPDTFERAMASLTASELVSGLVSVPGSVDTLDTRRVEWLDSAERYAARTNNGRLRSLAHGYRGLAFLGRSDYPAAESQLRRALFFASALRANDLAYRWHWRLAQTLVKQGRTPEALVEFDAALAALAPLRGELMSGYHDREEFFLTEIKPIYVEFVDVLLRNADARLVEREGYLDRALRAVEALKSAELQDYFRDECVVAQEAQALPIEQVARDAAVLYPIVLPDRVELLLRTQGRLFRHSVVIDQATLSTNALQLRELVQSDDSDRFLPYSQRMYRWLIAPLAADLATMNARTLVVVPDGVLRVIPFAVLHDGERFLIQKYALATTPSLTLTAPQPLRGNKPLALLTGVAQPVQGFAPLPKVSGELAGIREHVDGAVLIDDDYTTDRLAAALTRDEYAIVHMATHSVVGDTPADSYLLTYDGRLSMSDLEQLLRRGRFRRQPVELLTLSACDTAIGDERAALGLAGIALKAGARSALATLWRVADDSAATLMKDFYAGLTSAGSTSKADALRDAQLKMLAREATSHPAHWAAFMLIGNWL